MNRERVLVILKPDCVRRGLIGEVIQRFERKNLKIERMELRELPIELVKQHYAEHENKPFYDKLVRFMAHGKVVTMIVKGFDAIVTIRQLIGATKNAEPGSIRGDFAELGVENIVHASDSTASAEKEIGLFYEDQSKTD